MRAHMHARTHAHTHDLYNTSRLMQTLTKFFQQAKTCASLRAVDYSFVNMLLVKRCQELCILTLVIVKRNIIEFSKVICFSE